MIGYKSGLKSLIHFDELLSNEEYTITLTPGNYGTPINYTVRTDNHGEIKLDHMTILIHIERRETHGRECDRNFEGGKNT